MIRLLDCTLRDGGFVNDWLFGKETIRSIFRRLNRAGVDIVEAGFLDERRESDEDRSINPRLSDFDSALRGIARKSQVVLMIDYGTVAAENIPAADKTSIDGFRVIFKKKDAAAALAFCRALKEKGYFVSVQPVSVTTYSDAEMLDLIAGVNAFSPDAVSIVDTYGLLHREKLMHYFRLLDRNLGAQTAIGFHSHNNFQMAYANCMEILKARTSRDLIVDSSCYGMGKSAGNACTELLAMHLNDRFRKNYAIEEILEIIDSDIIKIYEKSRWGYACDYYISALSKAHPQYVQYLEKKKTLPVSGVLAVLSRIPESKKLAFDRALIERLYRDYQEKDLDDTDAVSKLTALLKDREVLLLGPGTSILKYKDDILQTIAGKNAVVIGVNCAPDAVPADYVFISNAKRYEQLVDTLLKNDRKVIASSNVSPIDAPFDFVVNFAKLTTPDAKVADNAIIMALRGLVLAGVDHVMLAGFDGFSARQDNFYNPYMEFLNPPDDFDLRNREIAEDLKSLETKIRLTFVTPSRYPLLMK